MICLSVVGAGMLSSQSSASPVGVLSSAFCLSKNCLLEAEHAFDLCYLSLKPGIYLFSVQLRDPTVRENKQLKIPIAEVSFTFKQLSIALTSMTQRKKKQTLDKKCKPNEQRRGDIGCVTVAVMLVCLFPLSPGSLLTKVYRV